LIADRVSFPRDKAIVFFCKGGGRSQRAAQHASSKGFTRVFNLTGGILSWIDQVDPKARRY
jgi:rhodanese-related sulfurtransferase